MSNSVTSSNTEFVVTTEPRIVLIDGKLTLSGFISDYLDEDNLAAILDFSKATDDEETNTQVCLDVNMTLEDILEESFNEHLQDVTEYGVVWMNLKSKDLFDGIRLELLKLVFKIDNIKYHGIDE